MSPFVNESETGGRSGTEVRRPEIGRGTVADRMDVPTFVVTNEALDPSICTLISNQSTETQVTVPGATLPGATNLTDVGNFSDSGNRRIKPVIEIATNRRRVQQRSQILQQWEGTVEEVRSDSFGARLRNLTSDGAPAEWATLLLNEISDNERSLVTPGAIFYWSIGYLVEAYGQRRTVSTIYFRQLPAWNDKDQTAAKLVAQSFADILTDDLSERSTAG